MSSVEQIKRSYEEGYAADSSKRRASKPGRKPLDTEAKNRRTAQNRAAQRAFRERKERKMRELEDKVQRLEEQHAVGEREMQALREHLLLLVRELRRWKPDSDVLSYVLQDRRVERLSRREPVLQEPEPVELPDTDGKACGFDVEGKFDEMEGKTCGFDEMEGTAQMLSPRSSASSYRQELRGRESSASLDFMCDNSASLLAQPRVPTGQTFPRKLCSLPQGDSPEAPQFSNTWGQEPPYSSSSVEHCTKLTELNSLLSPNNTETGYCWADHYLTSVGETSLQFQPSAPLPREEQPEDVLSYLR